MTEAACMVLCNCPDAATAKSLAETLVRERLAACVNLVPEVTSVYRWQGQVESATEVMLVAKTTRSAFKALENRLATLHPYEVPEIVALDINAGLPAYLQWIDECVTV